MPPRQASYNGEGRPGFRWLQQQLGPLTRDEEFLVNRVMQQRRLPPPPGLPPGAGPMSKGAGPATTSQLAPASRDSRVMQLDDSIPSMLWRASPEGSEGEDARDADTSIYLDVEVSRADSLRPAQMTGDSVRVRRE